MFGYRPGFVLESFTEYPYRSRDWVVLYLLVEGRSPLRDINQRILGFGVCGTRDRAVC